MKNFNKKFSIVVSLVTVIAFLFINDFINATYGWFRPSSYNVTLTLFGILIVSLLFIFYGHRLNKTSIIYIIFSIILFVAYFGFLFTTPSANMADGEGYLLSLAYVIGKYGIFVSGIIVFIQLLVGKKQKIEG